MADTQMRGPTFLILTALAEGRRHGYALINAVSAVSEGQVRLRVSTLYTALDRLSTDGLVTTAGEEIVAGRLRRYYELTEEGADALRREAARMRADADRAFSVLQKYPVAPGEGRA